jgi:hypothetical protein
MSDPSKESQLPPFIELALERSRLPPSALVERLAKQFIYGKEAPETGSPARAAALPKRAAL